jgi:hypothetical protein
MLVSVGGRKYAPHGCCLPGREARSQGPQAVRYGRFAAVGDAERLAAGRFAYRFSGKQKLLSIGKYPDVSLAGARTAREDAKALLAEGRYPSASKQLAKLINATAKDNFQAVAEEYVEKLELEGRAASTIVKIKWLAAAANVQDLVRWKNEAGVIASTKRAIAWRSPSRHEGFGGASLSDEGVFAVDEARDKNIPEELVFDEVAAVKGSRERGLVLHKLLEESSRAKRQMTHPPSRRGAENSSEN